MSPSAFLRLVMLMALAITRVTPYENDSSLNDEDSATKHNNLDDVPFFETQEPISLRGTSRFLAQSSRVVMTCNKYPRVCHAKSSPGPNCCKKKCVDVRVDRLNCGRCVKKCKYIEICCKGECVNPMSNEKHCGNCNNKCKKGTSCVYGMCSYA
ncbi:stigma-specific STIG1-like protein 1 [Quercus suber]|nr:stigma-specific stig1-like protein 3 [Quercus suber]